ncbi:hypothetical protein KC19_8G046000 [Ceratodon purpureus]|uniref:Phagocyte signaling-impaired protein n=1 Tax=Ceratodon purpureus TaxID=3225 RepID=A0A8T0H3F0_CERPU|nr:hypothetical protein KC19_8G046000 [Ceratodon purpureus]
MATRGGIPERKLKPLWDAIDHRQFKPALKLASQLQQKHPDSPYLFALKALILEKLGKVDEASELALRAKSFNPLDDITLNTLQTVLQRLNMLEAATALFEYACSKIPKNTDYQTALFNCYARQYNHVKQQQVAIRLYKVAGEERFLLWAVCSILLQANNNIKLLPLAEAMLKKHFQAQGFQDREGVIVYIDILKRQQKYGDALKLLQGLSGDLLTIGIDRLRLQGELLVHLNQHKEAADVFQEILKISSDDWAAFQMFLDATLKPVLPVSNELESLSLTSSRKEEVESLLQRVHAFVLELQALKVPDVRRGPYLAEVEIEKRLLILTSHTGEADASSARLAQSIFKYYQRFGSMASFTSDVMDFILHLGKEQQLWLIQELHRYCQDLPAETTPVKALHFRLAAFQVEGRLGWLRAHASEAGLLDTAKEIGHLFLESVKLSSEVDSQEAMLGGEFLTLISDLLVELFLQTKHIGFILEAVFALELGLALHRYHPLHKFLLVNFYSFLAAPKLAWTWFKAADVKYILLDSMSHHILPGLVSSLDWDSLDSATRDIIKFHDDYKREAADLAILAYHHNTYSKVMEFVAFKEKLERSHQLVVARIESAILSLKRKASNLEELEVALQSLDGGRTPLEWASDSRLDTLSFNEDLETRPWWSPTPDECLLIGSSQSSDQIRHRHLGRTEEVQKKQVCLKRHLKLRCMLPRLLHLALTINSGSREADLAASAELKELVLQYSKSLGVCADDLGPWLSEKVDSSDYEVGIVEALTLSLFWSAALFPVQRYDSTCQENLFSDSLLIVNKLMASALQDAMSSTVTGPEVVVSGAVLEKVVKLSTESMAWFGLCLQSWTAGSQPGSKKKKHQQSAPGPSDSFPGALQKAINTFCSQLEVCSSWVTEYLGRFKDKNHNELLAEVDTESTSSPGHVLRTLSAGLGKENSKIKSWDTILKEVIDCQQSTMTGIRDSCNSRAQLLKSIKF